jgi:multicomponent Na+:H+ antiporter subunit G
MTEVGSIVSAALMILGAGFCLLAALGIFRMPDLYMRMQAATKAGTLGVGCLALALIAHYGFSVVAAEAALIVIFLFLTAPIASHLIARAAYFVGVKQWEGSIVDEIAPCYDERTHALHSPDTHPVNQSDS